MDKPTQKQIAAIRKLARMTNSDVDFGQIGSKQQASRIIDDLIAKRNGRGGNGDNKCRDRKVEYGLAVKLVFRRYQQLGTNYRSESFWKEVNEFYRQYLRHQDEAIKPSSQEVRG